jgi:DNA-directed RNA polymerase specialized sigma24 family protein
MQEVRYKEEGKFINWAEMIAKNISIDHHRKIKAKSFFYCEQEIMDHLRSCQEWQTDNLSVHQRNTAWMTALNNCLYINSRYRVTGCLLN